MPPMHTQRDRPHDSTCFRVGTGLRSLVACPRLARNSRARRPGCLLAPCSTRSEAMVGGDLELIVEADENSGRSEHRHAAAFAC